MTYIFNKFEALKSKSIRLKKEKSNQPLRSELFNADQMELYGIELANTHHINPDMASNNLLKRLAENARIIEETSKLLIQKAEKNYLNTPAEEWLLDNFYLINEQIRTAKLHLPKKYSYGLPRLLKGPSADLPRIYDVALEIISHSDAHIDPVTLARFIASYQTVSPLELGELWALPIMLRLALIENLRRIAARLSISREHQNLADYWADKMLEMAEKDSSGLILIIADMARSDPPMDGAFVAEIVRRLQGNGPELALPLSWLEQRLSQTGVNIELLVVAENQQQAADQVSISNSIGSLRILTNMNWRDFVEELSLVEAILKKDPSGFYGQMDFATRDLYRHKVESLAKKSSLPENIVAQELLLTTKARADKGSPENHVGYYLIGKGRFEFEEKIGIHSSLRKKLYRYGARHPLTVYLGLIAILTGIASYGLFKFASNSGLSIGLLCFSIALSIIAASQFAISIVNTFGAMLIKPNPLPRLDFSEGIPVEASTIVVIPTMLTTPEGVNALCESLEVRYLANANKNLFFGLLTDFTDAQTENVAGDDELVARAEEGIESLNRKYAQNQDSIFFLFHRPREWNAQEKIWMGYERKRGKLAALNALLREGEINSFSKITGLISVLKPVRYVITLDTDTQLPWDVAWQCIGTMMHPLNRPHYDDKKRRVTDGYGILQPRLSTILPGLNTSLYATLFGGEPGIDIYTRMVSDVYQDVFGEGSFVGKGIYDVEAFERSLQNVLPKNKILSHDLLEGCYARAGLISDVHLYEAYPTRYPSDVARRHRWVRGDWQIANWVLPFVPDAEGKSVRNPLSGLSRWKIFDNLRRSLVAFSLTGLLIIGWTVISSPVSWTLNILAIFLIPLCMPFAALLHKAKTTSIEHHVNTFFTSIKNHSTQFVFLLASLPYEAAYHLDAILRTTWRLLVSRKLLLQWTPSGVDVRESHDLFSRFRSMWITSALVLSVIFLLCYKSIDLTIASPILLLWASFPAIAWYVSRNIKNVEVDLDENQTVFLRRIARKTWAFFETYVGDQDNWLPPDNVQEAPIAAIAHRTSPTNMGMSLLANLAAWDFGYVSSGTMMERTRKSLATMESLERFEGHFLNWYDTKTLLPLNPRYVSTVDSGNLAGHILTLRQGLLEIIHQPIIGIQVLHGLLDTLNLLKETSGGKTPSPLKDFENLLLDNVKTSQVDLNTIRKSLATLNDQAASFKSIVQGSGNEIHWAEALAQQVKDAKEDLETLLTSVNFEHVPTLHELSQTSAPARARIEILKDIAQKCEDMSHMSYEFLYNKTNKLLAIGYNVSDRRRDTGYYDLLASEARLTNFVAIAQRQIQQESWFALGRKLTKTSGKPTLVSWSGSMFEYLMPLLVMPPCENSLLDQACVAAVKRQIEYGNQFNIPWGISESGYHLFDAHMNYQYRAFGVPGLGLKRGLSDDLVIAPYASVMALMVAPKEAIQNMNRLTKEGFEGRFGYYEAIDYTPARLPRGKSHVIIKSFMVHHQGMSFLSLAYLLLDRPMQRRFEANPSFKAAIPLLHEKVSKTDIVQLNEAEQSNVQSIVAISEPVSRVANNPNTPIPQVQLLSNGRYHVMATNAGGSSSRWKDLAVTRYRSDATRDNWGTFCYIRDMASSAFWSAGHQPALTEPKFYESILSEGRVEYRRIDGDIETHTEVIVSPEDDIELRRSRITNRSRTRRVIEVTSYAEVVLAPQAADMAHPAFSNLFVQTEVLEHKNSILCTRRARSESENPPWMFHLMAVHDAPTSGISFETDRMKFIGRGNSSENPQVMKEGGILSGSEGSVLDPIVSVRRRIILEPEQTAIVDIVTGAADDKDTCLALIEKYQDLNLANRVFELAWSHSQVILRQLNANEKDAQLYNKLAGGVYFTNTSLRADASTLIQNKKGQSGLWSYAISGDFPIVLLQVKNNDNIDLVRQMVQAHAYWRLKGLAVDLVIWNEDQGGYRQALQDQIIGLISAGIEAHFVDRPGGIFVRPGDQISIEDRILLESVACVIIKDGDGTLEDQVARLELKAARVPRLAVTQGERASWPIQDKKLASRDLVITNNFGGFSTNGREYVINTQPHRKTPAPWSNVIANPYFGTVISESGQSYTWSENAHEFRLTPWQNDPVSDASGEAYYLRDEETGRFWSPAPAPSPSNAEYITRHGFGYSVFEHIQNGIHTELWVYVAIDAPVKFSVLKIRNESGRKRKLSATGYVEWVLGDMRSKTGMHIITEIDKNTGAVFARNAYNTEFAERIAFFDVNDSSRGVTCDRREFIGRNGSLRHPTAMDRLRLSGKTGPALDSCAALQTFFELADGESREVIFKLGITKGRADEASAIIRRFYGRSAARIALESAHQQWKKTLGAVQVKTPDPALNMLANGWLMYQTIACRLWARSGYYQSGGAFGFRDQLQDAMAVIHTRPDLLRSQLLLCAAHQFSEGDVQHWWHPPHDRGVRTKCSDDYLWLPLATYRYVTATGDTGVLDEKQFFLEGRKLGPDEDSYYDLPARSAETATLYEHCVRAVRHGLRLGEHGLPLIGSCDWNDGMDKVGEHGKGESVWLAFFLYDILLKFADIARLRDDIEFAYFCGEQAEILRVNIEKNGWDGGWYRRAYFDDGTPLGSAESAECQIDSLSQSWAILSGAGNPERSKIAMEAVNKRLVRRDAGLIQLLDPPFDKKGKNPGYIRGYVPGVRENGGQYTHAAIWTAMAFAKMGDSARAYELFNMINPINHSRTPEETALYKVEPYVVAADVYGVAPHTGRGGWTWYTGSSGWMYRLILESLLGLRLEGDKLFIEPCIPPEWDYFEIDYSYQDTIYKIEVSVSGEKASISLDGQPQSERYISLLNDGVAHLVKIRI